MSLSKIVALGTGIYHHYGLEAALKGIHRAGCGYVEMAANPPHAEHVSLDMDDAAVEALLAKLQQYRLKVVALNGNIGMMRKGDVERSKKLISLAPKLGAGVVVNTLGGAGLEEDLPPFLANVGEVADHARKNGVTIGLEVHGKHTANGKLALATVRAVTPARSMTQTLRSTTIPPTASISAIPCPTKTCRLLSPKWRTSI